MLRSAVVFAFLIHGIAQAQTTNAPGVSERENGNCSGRHRQGDTLRCYVKFDGKVNFTHVEVVFNLPDNPPPGAPGSYINFVLRESTKVDENTYEVSGVLPDCVGGTYILAAVSASLGEKGYRGYTNGYQFYNKLTVEFLNEAVPKPIEGKDEAGINQGLAIAGPSTTFVPDFEKAEKEADKEEAALRLKFGSPRIWEKRKGECGGLHEPGEELTCIVTFSGNPDMGGVFLNFNLRTPVRESQKGMCNGILLQKSERIDDQTYRVSGKLPLCASGRYTLAQVVEAGGGFQWNEPEFVSSVLLYLRNVDTSSFPNVRAVTDKPSEP